MSEVEQKTENENENAFEAPQANLTDTSSEKPILEMTRFSTWGVFFLSMITFGIYYIYWFISRGNKLNTLAKDSKTKMNMFYAYIVLYIVSLVISFMFVGDASMLIVGTVLSVVSMVAAILAVFSMRRSIEEVASVGSDEPVRLNGILTFFISIFYFPYKINQAIDNQNA